MAWLQFEQCRREQTEILYIVNADGGCTGRFGSTVNTRRGGWKARPSTRHGGESLDFGNYRNIGLGRRRVEEYDPLAVADGRILSTPAQPWDNTHGFVVCLLLDLHIVCYCPLSFGCDSLAEGKLNSESGSESIYRREGNSRREGVFGERSLREKLRKPPTSLWTAATISISM